MTTEIDQELEKLSLLEGRYYIILKPTDDENFSLSAYATVPEAADGEYIDAAGVAQEGLIAVLTEDLDLVFDRGIEALKSRELAKAIGDSADEDSEVARTARVEQEGNVLHIDFGSKQ
tara:strand:- start:2636 stop:2989 length:354 start_codon:yes stop_codon:yes gene_type:complete